MVIYYWWYTTNCAIYAVKRKKNDKAVTHVTAGYYTQRHATKECMGDYGKLKLKISIPKNPYLNN